MHMQYSRSLLQHVCDKQSTNSHLESQFSMLKSLGMPWAKNTGMFCFTTQNSHTLHMYPSPGYASAHCLVDSNSKWTLY